MLLPLLVLGALQASAPVRVTSPLVERMLARAVPPRPGEVRLDVLVSADSLRVGEQLDVVTVAWFPGNLLSRLPRPPVIRPPSVPGVFAAIQPTTPEVAGSRMVGDVRYDLYVAHHVVFPLDEGELRVPPASLRYSLPAGRQGQGADASVDRTATARPVRVLPLPPGGPGAVGTRLTMRWAMAPVVPRVGEPVPLELTLAGRGNIALWPAPIVRFPEGTRGYLGAEETVTNVVEGRFGGTRTWRYTLVVDSAGTVALPDLDYPHFDAERSVWREVLAKGPVLPVLPAPAGLALRAPVAELAARPLGLWRWSDGVLLAITVLAVGPLLLMWLQRMALAWRGRQPRRSVSSSEALIGRVRALVPEAKRRHGDALVAALREAGVPAQASADAAALYGAMVGQRFAPAGGRQGEDTEVRAARVLAEWPRRLLGLALVSATLSASTPVPVLADPDPVTLSRQAAAAWVAGQDAEAAAAWAAARHLAPRSAVLRDGWAKVALQGPDLQRLEPVSPLTPPEWALVGGALWALAGMAWMTRRRRLAGVALGLAVLAAGGSAALAARYARPEGIVARAVTARQAPHGLAAEQAPLDPLAVVVIRDVRPGWYRVAHPRLGQGWVPAQSVVLVPGAASGSSAARVR